MSSPTASDALPYPQRLEAILRAPQLPNAINLGKLRMTEKYLLQLAHQLQALCHVTHLNDLDS
jgi:hypothetical protein